MSAATELMVKYAAYHRDRRNLATHFVGVPMLVFAVGALLARPSIDIAGWPLTPAAVLWGLSTLWYLTRGDLVLGLASKAPTAKTNIGTPTKCVAILRRSRW